MAHTSEIEKLEQRWRDNPQSRHFAPLADAYRKTGQFDRAIEVLTAGLEHHPAYASAHIVLGRTRMDMEQPVEAEAAFRRVLELDGENVIAIRALAEISAASDRVDEAEHWLNYLLSIDAGNEDARAQLTAVAERRAQLLAQSAEEGGEEPAESAILSDQEDAVTEPAGDAGEEAAPEPAPAEGLQEPRGMEFMASSEVEPEAEGEGEIPPEAPPVAGAADRITPQPEAPGGEEPLTPEPDEWAKSSPSMPTAFEFGLERQEDIVLHPSGSSEFQTPDAARDLAPIEESGESDQSRETPELPDWASEERWGEDQWQASAGSAVSPGEESAEPEPGRERDQAGAFAGEPWEDGSPTAGAWTSLSEPGAVSGGPPDTAPASGEAAPAEEAESTPEPAAEPEAVPTESSALREIETPTPAGRTEPEAGSRRQLEDDRAAAGAPMTEPELVVTQSMGDVYAAQGHRREALQVYRQLLERSPDDARLRQKIAALSEPAVAPPPPVAHAARETGGQSVRDYFRGLLQPPAAEGAAEAAPAEPAAGPSAPDEAFGGEPGVGGAPTRPAAGPISLSDIFGEDSSPVPPVMPEGEEEQAGRGGLSFDEFFGETPPPRPEGKPRPRTVRLSQAEEDDLEQFHNWLKGLKR